MVSATSRREGFGLVEVIVATALLGVGIMTVAFSATFATRLLHTAEADEEAARLTLAVIDSLQHFPFWNAGTRHAGRFRIAWTGGHAGDVITASVVQPGVPSFALQLDVLTLPFLPLAGDSISCGAPPCD